MALPLLVVCGFGWTATVSTIISELQLFLPGWVRARAIAIYLMVFLGSQAVAAPIWGLVTAAPGASGGRPGRRRPGRRQRARGLVLRVPESEGLDRSPLAYWDTPRLQLEPEPGMPGRWWSRSSTRSRRSAARVPLAMRSMRRSRLRVGADPLGPLPGRGDPDLYVEQFQVPSWQEHQRQHEGRLTAEDKAIEDAAFAHVVGSPKTHHLLPAATVAADADQSVALGEQAEVKDDSAP